MNTKTCDITDNEKSFLKVISTSDSDYDKRVCARRGALNGTDGFQGCANFGNGCEFDGFYLARYSKEGLCRKCEFKTFPERYHGCMFCRKAMPSGTGVFAPLVNMVLAIG